MSQQARQNPEAWPTKPNPITEAKANYEVSRDSAIHHDLLLAIEDDLISRDYAIELSEARNNIIQLNKRVDYFKRLAHLFSYQSPLDPGL